MTARPRGTTRTASAAMARMALRGAPSAFLPPSNDGNAQSSAIAAANRLAATVLPTRFVKMAPISVTPMRNIPALPKNRLAASNAW